MHALGDAHEMPVNEGAPVPLFVQSPASGVRRSAHREPFQRSASDSHPLLPTARHDRSDGHDTAWSATPPSALRRGLAVRWPRQRLPSQRNASFPPTAVQVLAAEHEMLVRDRGNSRLVQTPPCRRSTNPWIPIEPIETQLRAEVQDTASNEAPASRGDG